MTLKKLNKKHIIIYGSNSLIAKSLKNIIEKKYNCIYFNRNTNLKDIKLIKKYEGRIYAILNLAFVTPNKYNLENFNTILNNIRITKQISLFSLSIKTKKFINFSSMSVYSEESGNYNENSLTNCEFNKDSNYGTAKLISEKLLSSLFNNTGIKLLHLRVSQVYGEDIQNSRIIPLMISELRKTNKITVFNEGKRVSNFISIDHLTKIVLFFLKKNHTGIFNVGEENISYRKLAKKIIKNYGNYKSKINFEKNDFSTFKFYLNTNKLSKVLKNEKI